MESKELLEIYGDTPTHRRVAPVSDLVEAPGFSSPDFRQLLDALWWPSLAAAAMVLGTLLFVLWTY